MNPSGFKTEGNSLRIALPFPSGHAHNKGHWRTKLAGIKAMKENAYYVAKQSGVVIWGRHLITYYFWMPDNRARDIANLVQQCKPYVDGIVQAGTIEDDNWRLHQIAGAFGSVDAECPRVEMHITADRTGKLLGEFRKLCSELPCNYR